MITIELEGKEYVMPEGWDEVSVGTFEKIVQLASQYAAYGSDAEYVIDMLATLTGAPKDVLLRITRKSFDDLSQRLSWVSEEVSPSNKESWLINGIEYMPVRNLDTLTMGDSVSMELMVKESNEANILGNLLPMLIRKVKKIDAGGGKTKKVADAFDANEYAETKELFNKHLMVCDVIRLKSFF